MTTTSADTRQRKSTKLLHAGAAEHLPCPRCDSTNTKFCYYNNYNFSQPRHFCKSCRRYWTHGGTLRDIPFGGGGRKNAKRCRTTTPTTSSASATAVGHDGFRHFPGGGDHGGGSFTSLMMGGGVVGLGGFGLGLGEMGFGLGRAVSPFGGVVEGGPGGVVSGGGGNTWQVENGGESGFVVGVGDYFSFPDLAISTPGSHVLK